MFTKEISRKRLPSIKYLQDDEERIICCGGEISPLEQTLKSTSKSLYIVAMAGQGKTITLRVLWIDYLCGNSETACLYVELKFLDKNKKDRAIRDYVFNEYRIELDKLCANQLILLLDGVDELDAKFKSNGWFASECAELLKKFRLVISERSYKIDCVHADRTSYGLDISQMQYCELCELTNTQLSNIGIRVKEGTALYNLLKNNMMLSIYSDLKAYGIEIDQDRITSGKLLDYYFNISIKTKFIKSHLNSTDNEVDLYEKIKKVERLNRNDCQGEQRDIFYALQDLSEVYEFLKDFSLWFFEEYGKNDRGFVGIGISKKDLTEKVKLNINILDRVPILKQKGDIYYWDKEIYQTYFAACKLRDILKSLQLGTPILKPDLLYFQNEMSYTSYMFWNRGCRSNHSSSVYLAIIYACELLDLNSKVDIVNFRDEIIKELNKNEDKNIQSLVLDMEDVICTFSVIKQWGFPDYATDVSSAQFSTCKLLEKIIIVPEQITKIGCGAFCNCENLSEIILPNTLKEIDAFAFGGTNITKMELPESLEKFGGIQATNIKKIKLPSKIKTLMKDAFVGCNNLEQVILSEGLETIEFGAFGNFMGGCTALENITLPSSLRCIDDYAFFNCGLKQIFLPKSLERIGSSAFSLCMNLTDIYCEVEKQPESWDKNWLDGCNATVHWGCEGEKI